MAANPALGALRQQVRARKAGAPSPLAARIARDPVPELPGPPPPPPVPPPTGPLAAGIDALRLRNPRLARRLTQLDPWQQKVVLADDRAALVCAGVGSGKTTVLAHKLELLHASGVSPDDIVVLTFTNQAASELRARLDQLGAAGTAPVAGTFHAVARRLLARRLPVETLGFGSAFAVIAEDERDALWQRLIETHGLTIRYRRRLERRIAAGGDGLIGNMRSPDDLQRLLALAEDEKRRLGVMDFDDLLSAATRLLLRTGLDPAPAWVVVDEFQDCDPVQLGFLEALVGTDTRLLVVGDPNQTIYAWRGSTPDLFDRFRVRHGARVYDLPVNYRCSARILACASQVIGGARALVPTRPPGEPVRVSRHHNPITEADDVGRRVAALCAGGVTAAQIAVLYRTRRQAAGIRAALATHGVTVCEPAPLTPRDLPAAAWFARLLRAGLFPSDERSMEQALGHPQFGVTDDDGTFAAQTRARVSALGSWLDERNLEDLTAQDLMAHLQVEALLRPTSPTFDRDRRQLTACLTRWLDEARTYAARPAATLARVVGDAPLGDGARAHPDDDDAGVRLLTIHGSKGLEFDHVFVVGANEGLLPLGPPDDADGLAEERRLFFVAITRARDGLEISWCASPEHARIAPRPSRFTERLPREHVRWSDGPEDATDGPVAPEPAGWSPGQTVRHPRYGRGAITTASKGAVVCQFPKFGEKRFVLAMAPMLERV